MNSAAMTDVDKLNGENDAAANETLQSKKKPPKKVAVTCTEMKKESAFASEETDKKLHPSPGSKRCCKKDLKECLKVGEILEIERVDQQYLDQYNNGEKLTCRFTGNEYYDLTLNVSFPSLSKWTKKRLVDVNALGEKSNISGWDFVSVIRNGMKHSLRMIVANENDQKKVRLNSNESLNDQFRNGPESPQSPVTNESNEILLQQKVVEMQKQIQALEKELSQCKTSLKKFSEPKVAQVPRNVFSQKRNLVPTTIESTSSSTTKNNARVLRARKHF